MNFLRQQSKSVIPTSIGIIGSDSRITQNKKRAIMTSGDTIVADDCSTSSNEEDSEQFHDNRQELGSFAASTCPIDFIDEYGNLPLTNISLLLPVVEEEEEEEENENDEINFFPGIPEKEMPRGEEETLDTLSTNESESTRTMDLHSSMLLEQEDDLVSSEHQQQVDDKGEQMKAICIMKDVIFQQRATIKRIAKDKLNVRSKYDKCKMEKKNLQKVMRKKMTKLTRKNQDLEDEIEMLRSKLELAQIELGRRRPVARSRKSAAEV